MATSDLVIVSSRVYTRTPVDNFVLSGENGSRANSAWEGRRGRCDKGRPMRLNLPSCLSKSLQNSKRVMEKRMHCLWRIVERRAHRDHMADQLRTSSTEKSGKKSAEAMPHDDSRTTGCFDNIH